MKSGGRTRQGLEVISIHHNSTAHIKTTEFFLPLKAMHMQNTAKRNGMSLKWINTSLQSALDIAGCHCMCQSLHSHEKHLKSGDQSARAAPGHPAYTCHLEPGTWNLLNYCSSCLAGTAGAARALWQRIEQELGWSWQHLVSLSGWPFVETLYRTFRRDIPETFGSRETLLRALRQVLLHATSLRLSQLACCGASSSWLLHRHARKRMKSGALAVQEQEAALLLQVSAGLSLRDVPDSGHAVVHPRLPAIQPYLCNDNGKAAMPLYLPLPFRDKAACPFCLVNACVA